MTATSTHKAHELFVHHLRSTDVVPQRRLVKDDVQRGCVGPVEDLLSLQSPRCLRPGSERMRESATALRPLGAGSSAGRRCPARTVAIRQAMVGTGRPLLSAVFPTPHHRRSMVPHRGNRPLRPVPVNRNGRTEARQPVRRGMVCPRNDAAIILTWQEGEQG